MLCGVHLTKGFSSAAVLTGRSWNVTINILKSLGERNWMTLDRLKVGTSAVITAVGGDGALRCRLLDMGLIPHTRVTLQKVAPMGDPIEIRVRGYELTLRVEEAQKIEVEGELK